MNRARNITCTHCHGSNYWKSNPAFSDVMHCRYCQTPISTYKNFVMDTAQRDAERLLAQFTQARTAEDLVNLRSILSASTQGADTDWQQKLSA